MSEPNKPETRLGFIKAAFNRPLPKVLTTVFALVGFYDTSVQQLLPPTAGEKFPNAYQLIKMTSGFFPFWGWLIIGMVLLTAVSVEYAFRRNKTGHDSRTRLETTYEVVFSGNVLTVTARELWGLIGPLRYSLNFSWSNGVESIFGEFEGHHPKMYAHDFDGDGLPEIILRYHTGAHTHVMHIYKINEAPKAPTLIPGAEIGSDFPEITWQPRKDDGGVTIFAKSRNWAGSPASDEPIIDRYIFENGQCVEVPRDRILDI